MAKQIGSFEIIIRGTKADGPTQLYIKYGTEESSDSTLRGRGSKEIKAPDLNKIAHNAGSGGELWSDCVAIAESDESIPR